MNASDLTPSQRGALVRFVSMSRKQAVATMDRRLSVKEFGMRIMLIKLLRKGVIEKTHVAVGQRGGEMQYYQPTSEGYRLADYISVNRLKTY